MPASPLHDQLLALLDQFAKGERPGDAEVVRALGEALRRRAASGSD